MKPSFRSSGAIASVACAAVLALTSCSSGTASANSTAAASNKTIKEGVLTLGTEIPDAPMEFYEADGKTPTGVDIDLMTEVAKRLNLKLDIQSSAWDGLIPAAKANRYDIVAAAMGDFTDRQKQIDFVDYLSTRSAVVVKASDSGFDDPKALCGKSIGGTSGSVAITIAKGFSADCEAAGSPAVKINEFPSNAEGLVALRSGRTDGQIMDGPSAINQAKTAEGGKAYKVALGAVGPVAIYGVGVSKTNTALRDAISEQLNAMIKDGKYKEILGKYGVQDYAIAQATVNAGGSK